MKTFFTSDNHFSHFNIIKYTNRPFNTTEEMNETMIRKWNEKVKPEDQIFILGDFCFKGNGKRGEGEPLKAGHYISQLNGDKIFLKGNHDNNNGIKSKIRSILIEAGGKEIYCTHDPADSHNFYPLNLVGHVHMLWKIQKDIKFGEETVLYNVGVDVHNFYPVELNEILVEYENFTKENI